MANENHLTREWEVRLRPAQLRVSRLASTSVLRVPSLTVFASLCCSCTA
jgi:hypothetical protein